MIWQNSRKITSTRSLHSWVSHTRKSVCPVQKFCTLEWENLLAFAVYPSRTHYVLLPDIPFGMLDILRRRLRSYKGFGVCLLDAIRDYSWAR